jgi:hypothetical protein
VVGWVVEDVVHGVLVLLLGLDDPGPEALAEDVVAAPVPLVEGSGVAAVEVAHAVGEVRGRRLEDEVVVVAHQTACVDAPAVAALDSSEGVGEDHPVLEIQGDRRAVVSGRPDVIESAGFEVATWTAHSFDGNGDLQARGRHEQFRHRAGQDQLRARHVTGRVGPGASPGGPG